jgi:hypothetical protein
MTQLPFGITDDQWSEIKNYTIMMDSSGMHIIPCFTEFHHLIQKLLGSRHVQGYDNISLSFPVN